jgi:hypothetical protein
MADKKLKIQPKYRQLAYSEKFVPELRLSGVWLEQSGFKIGAQVYITIKDQELVIKPAYVTVIADNP